jgi:hypothetical protein
MKNICSGMLALAASAVMASASLAGYGPTPPPGAPVPGGFLSVLTSTTLGLGGGTIKTYRGDMRVVTRFNGGKVPLQFTETIPDLAALAGRLPAQFDAVDGFGVQASLMDGAQVAGRFGEHGIVVTIRDPNIKPGDKLFAWSPVSHSFVEVHAVVHAGTVLVSVNHPEDLIVANLA